MIKYILQRIGFMAITLFLIMSITFFLMKLMPGSPFNDEKLSAAQKAIINEKYGLNDSLPVQYVHYLGKVIKGDFGVSFQYDNKEVWSLIQLRLGPSMEIGLYAMIVAVIFGILFGLISAFKKNTWIDYTSTVITVFAISVPAFVLAVLLQYFLAVKLAIFPVSGWTSLESAVLPTASLGLGLIAVIARYIRSEMIEVLSSDYILLARAKGLSEPRILFVHALRNTLIPLVTVAIPMLASVLTGTLTIETIFAIPGIGDQFVRSIQTNDYPVIMALTLLFSFLFVVSIFVVDILYGIIDPRIRTQGGKES
ncbi:ABC transporter permease [Staphylococcus simulans]|uniref:ABC transporter permease n=1 Tax=Staphylococcus simulans TaxID=1286 RepID=UPI000CD0F8D3|nr:ABC transporter permease [Staphylococcus simulans]PNZ42084.1 peptide ABC transporter permease [Staphylococcus simulans]SQE74773.1 oligopeptide transport system permease [Staphylococcus simulans]